MSESKMVTDAFGVSRPENSKDRIGRLMRSTPSCDAMGRYSSPPAAAPAPDAAPGETPTMVNALLAAAEVVGADPVGLVDSVAFMRSVAPISPADSAGLREAVAEAVALNPGLAIAPASSGMRPNPAQGSSASGMAVLTPTDALGRVRRQTEKIAGQPRPPGSTVN